jgi:Uma2 family endonuclease
VRIGLSSPSNRRRDRGRKADLYLRVGIPHYWIVDPGERFRGPFVNPSGS